MSEPTHIAVLRELLATPADGSKVQMIASRWFIAWERQGEAAALLDAADAKVRPLRDGLPIPVREGEARALRLRQAEAIELAFDMPNLDDKHSRALNRERRLASQLTACRAHSAKDAAIKLAVMFEEELLDGEPLAITAGATVLGVICDLAAIATGRPVKQNRAAQAA